MTLAFQNHNCALSTSGGVWCWGSNSFGQVILVVVYEGAVVCWGWMRACQADDVVFPAQLGDGTVTNRLTPVAVPSLSSGVVIIAANDVRFVLCRLLG